MKQKLESLKSQEVNLEIIDLKKLIELIKIYIPSIDKKPEEIKSALKMNLIFAG